MKPTYKPSDNSRVGIKEAMAWYENLNYSKKKYIDKLVEQYILHVKSKSKSQASKNMGIELIYKVMRFMEVKDE